MEHWSRSTRSPARARRSSARDRGYRTSQNVTSNDDTFAGMLVDLLAQAKPAGGAALDQVAIANGASGVVTAALLWLGMGHRSGKVAVLGRIGRYSERVSGLPAWAAVPSGMIVASLVTALFGMM